MADKELKRILKESRALITTQDWQSLEQETSANLSTYPTSYPLHLYHALSLSSIATTSPQKNSFRSSRNEVADTAMDAASGGGGLYAGGDGSNYRFSGYIVTRLDANSSSPPNNPSSSSKRGTFAVSPSVYDACILKSPTLSTVHSSVTMNTIQSSATASSLQDARIVKADRKSVGTQETRSVVRMNRGSDPPMPTLME
ncbi:hypothetical protein BT69DRAFT_1329744 [Atractiella rhizophila]|nr:hypothetical protein BT69DRAFT_1329744 [Atractiella rhizophila]